MQTKNNLKMPPMLPDETLEQYTDRLTGADGGTPPYPEHRNRQCSIGYHDECTDAKGKCKCPCHYPHGLNAEAICANLVQLLREGYEMRFKTFEHAGMQLCSITIAHPRRCVHVSKAGTFEDLADVIDFAYNQVPEVKDETV